MLLPPAAMLLMHRWGAQSSCCWNIWRHAGGQIHKPWEKAALLPYKAAIHPLPCSSPAPRPGVGGYLQRALGQAWSSLLGAQPVGGTAVHLSSDEGKWMSGVSPAAALPDEAAESPSPQQTAGRFRCVPAAVEDGCSTWESLVMDAAAWPCWESHLRSAVLHLLTMAAENCRDEEPGD